MGNILKMPGTFAPEKKASAFKTISFLVSSPEIEPGTNCSDHKSGDAGDHADVPVPRRDWYLMGGLDGDADSRKNPAFLNDRDNFPKGIRTEEVMLIPVSYSSPGEKTITASSLPGNSCRDISGKKNDIVDYPGRSVLYSRQFRPLNHIISTEYKKPRSGEPWINPSSKPLFWSVSWSSVCRWYLLQVLVQVLLKHCQIRMCRIFHPVISRMLLPWILIVRFGMETMHNPILSLSMSYARGMKSVPMVSRVCNPPRVGVDCLRKVRWKSPFSSWIFQMPSTIPRRPRWMCSQKCSGTGITTRILTRVWRIIIRDPRITSLRSPARCMDGTGLPSREAIICHWGSPREG